MLPDAQIILFWVSVSEHCIIMLCYVMIVPLCQRRDIQEEPLVQISQTSVFFRKFKENNGSGLR